MPFCKQLWWITSFLYIRVTTQPVLSFAPPSAGWKVMHSFNGVYPISCMPVLVHAYLPACSLVYLHSQARITILWQTRLVFESRILWSFPPTWSSMWIPHATWSDDLSASSTWRTFLSGNWLLLSFAPTSAVCTGVQTQFCSHVGLSHCFCRWIQYINYYFFTVD